MILLDQIPKPTTAKSSSQPARSQAATQRNSTSPVSMKKRPAKKAVSDSETETEEEPEELLLAQKASSSATKSAKPQDEDVLMTPARSVSPTPQHQEADPGRVPGRIIGLTNPLADFNQNLAVGDIVTKAMEDMGWAITEVVMRPFARRRTKEMIECMQKMREVAKEVRCYYR